MEEINWVEEWKKAQCHSRSKAHTTSEALWTSYWDYIAERYLVNSISNEKAYRSIIAFLGTESCFMKGDSVLDIGCGPGTYTLLFAEEACAVAALDTSRGMLTALMAEAARRKLHNIRAIPSSWEDYQPEDRYGLVFSGMSPAIHDERTLLKMEQYASRGCCVVTYGEAFEYPAIKDLWGLLVGEYRPSNAYLHVYPHGVLQQKGRNPVTRMFSIDHRRRGPINEIVSQYTKYFSIFTAMDEKKAGVIRQYFDERSQDSFFEDVTQLDIAAICWKVPLD